MMDKDTLEQWKDGVMEHTINVQQMIKERKLLKKHIEEHLSQFFKWNDIDYSKDFDVITLKWDRDVNPVIKKEKIHELGIDWIIRAGYDDQAFRIVVIELYPFGLPKEGEIVDVDVT